ncbi:hypothetical protein DVH05_024827 [Phytophthora capsici]|nr:hypothetical protein DVH05_018932 [Phytophthora capsici]KAG1684885.1 hypothetical protein DVH05_010203 [Phytophthora capsici]KAG1686485.1 hypothetical protein DVH05_006525 [Phytophthora capsici]KAG1708144.1 hypothetical protein DVH05_024827 [Phytophthora capsici]|eukprot:jgi/Phyca11/132175/e_gw1.139.24.1
MAYSQEKYQANKERIAATKKRYYERNREKILAKQKAYDDQHRVQIAEKDRKRKAKKVGGRIALD